MNEHEKLNAAHYLHERLCDMKTKPTWQIFKRFFACKDPEAIKLLGYAISKSNNPNRWMCKQRDVEQVGKLSENENTMLFYAFRYCLGRRTYAVSDFCDYATAHVTQIRTKELHLMAREITDYELRDKEDPPMKWLGDECDRVEWLKLRSVINDELIKRTEENK